MKKIKLLFLSKNFSLYVLLRANFLNRKLLVTIFEYVNILMQYFYKCFDHIPFQVEVANDGY